MTKLKIQKIIILWAPVLIWSGAIYYVSSIPSLNSGLGLWDFFLRKGAHVFEYLVLMILWVRALRRTNPGWPYWKVLCLSFIMCFLYAASDEIHQRFVPGRGASIGDVLIDSCGMLMIIFFAVRQSLLKPKSLAILLVGFLGLTGCGPTFDFGRAKNLESKKKYEKAWEKYQEFVARYPRNAKAPEALFRAGLVAQQGTGDCTIAKNFYEQVTVKYPQSEPWAQAASFQMINCPDYYPLTPGTVWEEGDSDTKGGLARTEIECKNVQTGKKGFPSEKARLVRAYYSGNNKFKTAEFVYKKENDRLAEFEDERDVEPKVLIKWPLVVGTNWRTKTEGRVYHFEIVSVEENVKVKAGEFSNCLKVWAIDENSKLGGRFEYYAPGVGRVLTTLSTGQPGEEKRLTELLSYKLADSAGFDFEEKKATETKEKSK